MWKKLILGLGVGLMLAGLTVTASAPNGAIFTTLPDGSRVNYNIYASKPDVYLDGGPGDQAPQHAAGLPDGTYVFQVTDPSGKVLLSVDQAKCRQFVVEDGVIKSVVATGCEHAIGIDKDHGDEGAVTVQLCGGGAGHPLTPTACFLDTPNPGGEYKVWVTMVDDYLDGCELLGKPNGLEEVDCGGKTRGNAHGFIPRHSKTDNFKVGGYPREIDTRFHRWDGVLLDGMMVTWTDTLGASNNKFSYEDLSLDVHHEAHVEDVEPGTHTITLTHQPGCTIGTVYVAGVKSKKTGPQTVSVTVKPNYTIDTYFVDVFCQ